jgi:hypothetical protein
MEGRITYVRRVGLGFWHATSAIEIRFDRLFVNLQPLSIDTRVEEIENGRESVKGGVIEGVGSKNTPQHLMTERMLHLPYWDPDGYWIFMARRAVFPFFPEPEIYLPAGTELRLRLAAPLEVPAEVQIAEGEVSSDEDAQIDPEVRTKLLALPTQSVTGAGKASDVVNLAFVGTAEQVEAAFGAAGWTYGDRVSTLSVLREMRALSSQNSYSHLPISRQWLNGDAPEFRLQKSFDSYEKREHIRIWDERAIEPGIWVSGAIAETSARWSFRKGKFIHHVDSDLDAERERVAAELQLTGCVEHVYHVRRRESPEGLRAASGDELRTDGTIAVIQLRDCDGRAPEPLQSATKLASRPRSRLARFVRSQALSVHDLWQSNVIYMSVDISRSAILSFKNHRLREREAAQEALTRRENAYGAN